MRRPLLGSTIFASALGLGAHGCNSIIGNDPGTFVASTDPDLPAEAAAPSPLNALADGGPDAARAAPDNGDKPSPGCPDGQRLCFGTCVSMTDPLYGCGSATCTPCPSVHSTMACQGRSCIVVACDDGYSDCNKNAADGCEADLSMATTCGTVCPPGAHRCGAKCAPDNDVTACGAACAVCPIPVAGSTVACVAGACVTACAGRHGDCDGNPANGCEAVLSSDAANCGSCGRGCPGHKMCVGGVCTPHG